MNLSEVANQWGQAPLNDKHTQLNPKKKSLTNE